jgi:Tfp pilus assembly protein FimV
MAQSIYDAQGQKPPGSDENGQLAPTTERVSREISGDMFMKDYEVAVEVTQGIAGSQIAESQHFAQVMQILGSSNMDASLMKAWIEGDPSFSRKVKSNLKASIDAVENSQLAQKQAEIDQLKQYIQQMSVQMQQFAQQIDYQKAQVKAIKDAASENAKMNQQFVSAAEQNYKTKLTSVDTTTGSTVSEGQVKSQNAKGEQGGSFDTL